MSELIFYLLCSFIQSDGYSHFSLSNINISHIGIRRIKQSLTELELSNRITNCTINGYYLRYLIHDPKPCPSFLFNINLSLSCKLYILHYLFNIDKFINCTKYIQLRNIDSYFSNLSNFTLIKRVLGYDIFSLPSHIKFVSSIPYHVKYPLVKTENGYCVDKFGNGNYIRSLDANELREYKHNCRIRRIYKMIEGGGIGVYLMYKLRKRMASSHGRFVDTDLDIEYLNDLFLKLGKRDFYTGLPFSDLTQVSIDRIDSSGSYTLDNVVLTTSLINRMKSEYSMEEFLQICNLVSNNFPILNYSLSEN